MSQRRPPNANGAISHTPEADALKLEALRVQLKAGVDALERGEFTEIEEAELENFLAGPSEHR